MNENEILKLANRNAELVKELSETRIELEHLLEAGIPTAFAEKLLKCEETIRRLAQTSAENEMRLRDAMLEIGRLKDQVASFSKAGPALS